MAFQIQRARYTRTIKCYKNQTYMFYFPIIIHSDALCSIDCQWDKVFSWMRIVPAPEPKPTLPLLNTLWLKHERQLLLTLKGVAMKLTSCVTSFHENQNGPVFFLTIWKERKCILLRQTFKKEKTIAQWLDKSCR